MDIMELLKTRRTYRRFKQDPVPDSVVEDILTAARYASSAANKQPLSFVVVKSPEMVKKTFSYTRWAGYLPPEVGQPKEGEEPTLFIGVVENLTLAAWDKGVGSCVIGACNKVKLSELFGLTENQTLHTVVAFGYPTHKSKIKDINDEDVKYFIDGNGDYVVPKRKTEDVTKYL